MFFKAINSRFKDFLDNKQGVAYLEFAITLPVLLLLFGNAIDMTRLILLHQKIDKSVFTIGDLVTQMDTANPCPRIQQLEQTVAKSIMRPFEFNSQIYSMSVTAVIGAAPPSNPNVTRNMIEWRYNIGFNSTVGAYSQPYRQQASLPASLGTLDTTERLIVSEMRYRYDPMIPALSLMDSQDIYKVSYMRGRVSSGNEKATRGLLSGCSV